jgi:hypothetical protein
MRRSRPAHWKLWVVARLENAFLGAGTGTRVVRVAFLWLFRMHVDMGIRALAGEGWGFILLLDRGYILGHVVR